MYTSTHIQTHSIDRFIECVEEFKFFDKFKEPTYMWGNFGYHCTGDIDLVFIGEPTEELAKKLIDFKLFAKERGCLKLDCCVCENTKLFSYIPEMNENYDVKFVDTIKYKLGEHPPRAYGQNPEKINKYFWKYNAVGLNLKSKLRFEKQDVRYPIRLEEFIKLVYNIKNQEIYNTEKDKTFKLQKEQARLIKNAIR